MPATKEQLRRLMELDKFFQKSAKWKAIELIEKLRSDADIDISDRTLKADLSYLIEGSRGILTNEKIGKEWFWYYTDSTYSHFRKALLPSEFNDLRKMITTFKEWGDLPFWEEIDILLSQFETRFLFNNRRDQKLIEFQKPISIVGGQWLKVLYNAIENQKTVDVFFRSLRSGQNRSLAVYPYLLKEYNNRWWLIGWGGKTITNIALENIYDIEIADNVLSNTPAFNPHTYFENVLGVTVNQGPVETIRLKVDPKTVDYLRTKPIHPSQHEENTDGTEITLRLIPNYELHQAILQYGASVEVLEPESLRKTIREILRKAADQYVTD